MSTHHIVHLCFAAVAAALSFWMWYIIRSDFSVVSLGDMVSLAAAMTLVMAVLILSVLLFSRRESYVVFAVFLVPFLALAGLTMQYVAVALAAFLLLAYGAAWAHHLLDSRTKISFYPLIGYGTPTLLTAIALLFAALAYHYPIATNTLSIPPAMMNWVTPFADRFVGQQFSAYQPGMTLDELFESTVLEASGVTDPSQLTPSGRALVDSEIARERVSFGEQLGVTLTGKETVGDLVAVVANTYLNRYLGSYKDFLPIIVAAFVFLTIKSVGFVIDRLAVLFAWLFVHALVAAGVVRKEKIPAEKEVFSVGKPAPKEAVSSVLP